jgi:ABC-type transporter Mla subunit MlaD
MVEANRYKLGLFIAAALVLSVVTLVYVGLDEYFMPKLKVFTVFKNSVEGLKEGAPVKFKGVTIGKVDRIAVRYGEGGIDIYMTLFPSSLDVIKGSRYIKSMSAHEQMNKYLKSLASDNACCSLQASGLMGGLFVNIERKVDDYKGIYRVKDLPPGYEYIPSRQTHISNVIENVSKTAEQLANIDVVKLDKELTRTIQKANSVMEKFANSNVLRKAKETFEKIDKAIDQLSDLTDRETIKLTLEELRDCLSTVNNLSRALDKRVNGIEILRSRLNHSLSKINQAMEKISQVATSIDEDPSSIVRGKSKPRIIKKDR